MSDEETVYRQALERLARGGDILVLEDLARAAESLRAGLAEQVTAFRDAGAPSGDESVKKLLDEDHSGAFVALSIPIATYGGSRALRALALAFSHIGRAAVSDTGSYEIHNEAGTAIVGRLLWGLTAQGLAADNPHILTVAQAARLPKGTRGAPPCMSEDRRLRYAATLGGNAKLTFDHYRDWLVGNQLIVDTCPYLATDGEICLQTVDALFALATVESGLGRTYSHGIFDGEVAARIASHARSSPAEVARFLGVAEPELGGEIQRRAELIDGPNRHWNDSPYPQLLGTGSR